MLGLHLAAVLATAAAVLLGLWQYGVWQTGREDKSTSQVDARPVPLSSVMSSDEAFPRTAVGKPVRLSGRWLPRSTLYVADKQLHGRTGVWVVTPVAVCPRGSATTCRTASAMLVVRGWAPSVARSPAAPTGPVAVTGWLQPGEGSDGADSDPSDDVIPQLTVPDAIQHVPQDLYGAYVIARTASGAAQTGITAVTPAAMPQASTFTSLRNLLYALEWWFFGGFAIYVWGRWCRDEVTRVTGVASEA
jgi:surfeit locus 1 family protein